MAVGISEIARGKSVWKRLLVLLLVLGLMFLPLHAVIAQLSNNVAETQAEPSEIIIVYDDALSVVEGAIQPTDQADESSSNAVQAVSNLGITQQSETPCAVAEGTMTVAELPEGLSAQTATEALSDVDGIAYVQPNYEYQPLMSTSDPYCVESSSETYNQYYLFDSGVTEAWDEETSSGNVTVAVIDTGCDLTHSDLVNNIDADHAYDAVAEEALSDGNDTNGHGTKVCGVIAGEANNGIGIAGASYNAKLLPVKVFDSSGKCHTSDIVAGYSYLSSLVESGELTDLKVVNVSLGYYSSDGAEDQLLETAISKLKDEGVLTVAAGGNGGVSSTLYPSDFDDVLSVVGINQDGTIRSDADVNDCKDVATYGTSITTTANGGGYAKVSGSSFASPLVSGVAALVSLKYPNLTVDEVAARITDTSTVIAGQSFGALDAKSAVGHTHEWGAWEPVEIADAPLGAMTSTCKLCGTSSTVKLGDANLDDVLDVRDLVLMQRLIAGKSDIGSWSVQAKIAANINQSDVSGEYCGIDQTDVDLLANALLAA